MSRGSAITCLFGKHPSQGDFLRVNMDVPGARELDAWIGRAYAQLARDGGAMATTRFVFRGDPPDALLIGCCVASRDSAGRSFPLAAFVHASARAVARRWSALPRAYASFLADCERLLEGGAQLEARALTRALAGLTVPDAGELHRAHDALVAELDQAPPAELLAGVYGSLDDGQHLYGLNTALLACASFARPREALRARVTLDCPVKADLDVDFWLHLLAAGLGWRDTVPALVWRARRLLIAPGAVSAAALRYLHDPALADDQLWALRTNSAAAIQRARDRLEAIAGAAALERRRSSQQLIRDLVC